MGGWSFGTKHVFSRWVLYFSLSMSRDGIKKSKGVSKVSCGLWNNGCQRFHPVVRRVHGGSTRRAKVCGIFSSYADAKGRLFIMLVSGLYCTELHQILVPRRLIPFRSDSTSVFHSPFTQESPLC